MVTSEPFFKAVEVNTEPEPADASLGSCRRSPGSRQGSQGRHAIGTWTKLAFHSERIIILNRFFALTLALLSSPVLGQVAKNDVLEQARSLHERMITIDAHVDVPPDFGVGDFDPARDGKMQVDLPKLDRGIQTGAVFAVFVSQSRRTPANYEIARAQGQRKLDALLEMADKYSERIQIARSAAEVERIHQSGKHVAVIGMLNGYSLGPGAELLDDYHRAGLRQFGFVHAGHNGLADSSRPSAVNGDKQEEHGGLSALGKTLVARLNDLGILIDVTQLSSAALGDVIELSRAPVIASHSAARARIDNPRNLTDKEMRMIADTGGVVHIVAFSTYLRALDPSALTRLGAVRSQYGIESDADMEQLSTEQRARLDADLRGVLRTLPKASLEQYIDIVDYAVELIGVEHVGIASDFGHGGGVEGWLNAGESINVTAELLRRGYSQTDIAKLWGLNWLRALAAAENEAKN